MTLGGHLKVVSITCKTEMLCAVSKSSRNDEHISYVVDNTINWLNQCHSYPLSLLPISIIKYPFSQTVLQVCEAT